MKGYYLIENQCLLNPNDNIQNCLAYSDKDLKQCSMCK